MKIFAGTKLSQLFQHQQDKKYSQLERLVHIGYQIEADVIKMDDNGRVTELYHEVLEEYRDNQI